MISQSCSLIQHDLYSYDIVSAYPTILGKQFYNFDGVDLDNKTERSMFIGNKQKNNSGLSQFLIKSANSLVTFYLNENNVLDDEIISTQRDGFILTRLLDNDDQFIDMKLREIIDFLIISIDRENFIYFADGEIHIKGVPYYYDGLKIFYNMFSNLNFYNKNILFEQMENIKHAIFNIDDVTPFLIPKDENSFIVITYKGNIEVKDPDFISTKSIDRSKYFNHFFSGFLKSLFIECY